MSGNRKRQHKKNRSGSQNGNHQQDGMDVNERSITSVEVDGEVIKRNDLVMIDRDGGQDIAVVRNLLELSSAQVFTGQLVVASTEGDQYYFTHLMGTFTTSSIVSKIRGEDGDLTASDLKLGFNFETEEIVEIVDLPSVIQMDTPPLAKSFNVPRREPRSACALCDGSGEGSIVRCSTCKTQYHKGCLPEKIAELAVAESEEFECWNCTIADPSKVITDMDEQDFADRMVVWREASAVDAVFAENFYETILPFVCLKVYESEHVNGEPFRNLISYFVANSQTLDSHLKPLTKLLPLKHSDVRAAIEKAWQSNFQYPPDDEITSIFALVFCMSIKTQRALRPDQLSVVDNFEEFDNAKETPLEVDVEDGCQRALEALVEKLSNMSKAFDFTTEFAELQEIEKRVINVEHFDEQVYQAFKNITDDIHAFPQNVLDKDLELHKFTKSHEMLGDWIQGITTSFKSLGPEMQSLQKLHHHCSDIPLFVNSVRQTIASIRNSIQHLQRESKSMLEKSTNQIKERVEIHLARVADWHQNFHQNLKILNDDIYKQGSNLKAWESTKLSNLADERRKVYNDMVEARDDYLKQGTTVEAMLEGLLNIGAPEVVTAAVVTHLHAIKAKTAECSVMPKSPAAKSPTTSKQNHDASSFSAPATNKPKSLKRAADEETSLPTEKSPKKSKKARRQDTPMPRALRAATHASQASGQVSPQLASHAGQDSPPFPKSRLTFDNDGIEPTAIDGETTPDDDETNGSREVTMLD